MNTIITNIIINTKNLFSTIKFKFDFYIKNLYKYQPFIAKSFCYLITMIIIDIIISFYINILYLSLKFNILPIDYAKKYIIGNYILYFIITPFPLICNPYFITIIITTFCLLLICKDNSPENIFEMIYKTLIENYNNSFVLYLKLCLFCGLIDTGIFIYFDLIAKSNA